MAGPSSSHVEKAVAVGDLAAASLDDGLPSLNLAYYLDGSQQHPKVNGTSARAHTAASPSDGCCFRL
jgi:hypothetical protein